MSEEIIFINKPDISDWNHMKDEYGWGKNDYVLSTPVGKYLVGKRIDNTGTEKWFFTDNPMYHYAITGREYPTRDEAMEAAWEHYKHQITYS